MGESIEKDNKSYNQILIKVTTGKSIMPEAFDRIPESLTPEKV